MDSDQSSKKRQNDSCSEYQPSASVVVKVPRITSKLPNRDNVTLIPRVVGSTRSCENDVFLRSFEIETAKAADQFSDGTDQKVSVGEMTGSDTWQLPSSHTLEPNTTQHAIMRNKNQMSPVNCAQREIIVGQCDSTIPTVITSKQVVNTSVDHNLKPTTSMCQQNRSPANHMVTSSLSHKVVEKNCDSPKFRPTPLKSKQMMESIGVKKRTCNCTRSLCLKLYCECFANGELCFTCNCTNCFNTLDNEVERNEAIRVVLERNPNAFHPKVGKMGYSSEEKSHYRGCNCKKTNCAKNYCECFEARILCTSLCKCVDCYNCEERFGMRLLEDVTPLRLLKEGTLRDLSFYRNEFIDKLPFTLMTQEVIEATIQCLLAQAEEALVTERSVSETECMLLQEFGSCTTQIIENAASFKTPTSETNNSFIT